MKWWLLFFILIFSQICPAQNTDFAYRIYFTDKNQSTFSLDSPAVFLSQRSIQRRIKYSIAIDSSDLPVCQNYIDTILTRTNGTLHCLSKWQNTMVVMLSDTNTIQQIIPLPFVESVRLVAVYPGGFQKPGTHLPANKPTGFDQNFYGAAWTQISLCKGQTLHQENLNGKGIFIALIDAGFEGVDNNNAFDSIRNNNQIISRWNFVHNLSQTSDEGSHGTEVLSIIAANIPQTFVGTAPKAKLALFTSEDLNSEQPIEQDNWLAAAEKADSLGVDLITTSLGYNTYDPPFPDETYSNFDGKTTFIAQGANAAAAKGILVVASAGNEGLSPWHYILTPGDADSAFTIGAVDISNSVMPNSGYGPNADSVLKPDVVAMGSGNAVINNQGLVSFVSGTSFATPIIAGLAACLMQKDSQASPYLIKQLIRESADHYYNPNDHIGYGLPNFSKALNLLTGIRKVRPHATSNNFSIFPNPVRNQTIHIKFQRTPKEITNITISNAEGKIIYQKEFQIISNNLLSISLPKVAAGQYFVTVSNQNTGDTKSFILY